MGFLVARNPWILIFGILGNLISLMVLLAPLPTFYRICKKKSTEGFLSTPYVVTLFSSTLWIYYALLSTNANLVLTINLVACATEAVYIGIYLTYASKKARIVTLRWLLLLNVGAFSSILLLTLFLAKGLTRLKVMGWICMVFTISVFVAPLSIMKQVIHTKSIEFMPFPLSFFLTLSAIAWFFYGFFIRDYFIALPNIIGFIFGVLQIVLYAIYRRNTTAMLEQKLPTHQLQMKETTCERTNADQHLEEGSLDSGRKYIAFIPVKVSLFFFYCLILKFEQGAVNMQRDNGTSVPSTPTGRIRHPKRSSEVSISNKASAGPLLVNDQDKHRSMRVRALSTAWMIAGFVFILYMGHLYIWAMIVVIQIFTVQLSQESS
ncbi:bidirectional sugar transporter N3-like [Aristolochia californica]|uniref:bidirectional sugar transporter N3-like n=1 Tax=Aristolochia californica TaxID=171875 RepID=UPI0035DDBC4B